MSTEVAIMCISRKYSEFESVSANIILDFKDRRVIVQRVKWVKNGLTNVINQLWIN